MGIFEFFRRWFNPSGNIRPEYGKSSPDFLKKMLIQIQNTEEVELSCDEVLALMDQAVEAVLRGEDFPEMMPLVQHHLDMCKDCHEEFEALLQILKSAPSHAIKE